MPRGITSAGNPAGAAWGAVQDPSFLKQPHPSGHRLELGQERHLEIKKGNGSTIHSSPLLLQNQESRPPVPSRLPGPGASTCVRVELELSLRARGCVSEVLLLLFPLFHLQNSLQEIGEIAQARGFDAEAPQAAKWSQSFLHRPQFFSLVDS